tara:strand:+ start:60 stop:899 length:840 start_codon:yes stop_codon:yes gene_type:complete
MSVSYIAKSYAKINLGLKIFNKRKDGFHNLKSIFIEIDLYDSISFKSASKFSLTCSNNDLVPDKSNTVFQTYFKMKNNFNFKKNYSIHLDKNIPIESGMGGGSSNAACVIKSLNKLENLNLSKKQMMNLAQEIGSDVPFFIDGNIKFIEGRGEIVYSYKAPILKDLFFLIILPPFSISTKWAFGKIKKDLEHRMNSYKFPPLDNNIDWEFFKNDFEEVVGTTYPEIYDIKKTLYDNGALYSGLSGSGSTMFGIYNDIETARKAVKNVNKYHTHIASPVI